jgi:hypothetical protein
MKPHPFLLAPLLAPFSPVVLRGLGIFDLTSPWATAASSILRCLRFEYKTSIGDHLIGFGFILTHV